MANCYFCNIKINNGEGYRRTVMTSQSVRAYFSGHGGSSYGQTYGLRTLCHSCASALDKKIGGLAWKIPLSLFMSLVGIVLAARNRGSVETALESLIFAFFLFGGLGLLTFIGLQLISALKSSFVNSLPLESDSDHELSEENEEKSSFILAIPESRKELESIGISVFGCYEIEASYAGINLLIEKVFSSMPVENYSSSSEFKECFLKNTCNIFINTTGAALNQENIDIEKLFAIFPGLEEEEFENYLKRLSLATKKAGNISKR